MTTSIATLDATNVCNDIAEMEMPQSTRTAPEGSLSAMFEGITPATLESTPETTEKPAVKKPAKKLAKKSAPKASTPAPAPKAEAEPAPAKAEKSAPKVKPSKTILKGGLTYSLLSRVRNAFPADMRSGVEEGHDTLEMVDGRGTTQTISSAYVAISEELGGAKYLSTVRTSHVKRALKENGTLPAPKK